MSEQHIKAPPEGCAEAFAWPPENGGSVHVEQEWVIPGKAMILRGMLSPEECRYIIERCEETGFEKLSKPERQYRTNERVIMEVPDTARTIHERIAPFLPKQMERPRGPGEFAQDQDTWGILECNPRMRFCK